MTPIPCFRATAAPTRPASTIQPMDPKSIPHRLAMPAEAWRRWKENFK